LKLYDESHYSSVTPEERYEQLFRSQQKIDSGVGLPTDHYIIHRVTAIVRALGIVNCFNDWERTTGVFNKLYASPGTTYDSTSVRTVDCFPCWTEIFSLHG
jgi:hypothetical protein